MGEKLLLYSFCLLILIVLRIGMEQYGNSTDKSAKRFRFLVSAVAFFAVVNGVCELVDNRVNYTVLNFALNIASYIMVDIVVFCFIGYLEALLEGSEKNNKGVIGIGVLLCVIDSLTTIVLTVLGKMFTVDEN